MKSSNNQSGFSVVELAIVGAIVLSLGFVGYKVYNRQSASNGSLSSQQVSTSVQSDKANDVATAPVINSSAGLTNAMTLLDQTNPSGSNNTDATQVDEQLTSF